MRVVDAEIVSYGALPQEPYTAVQKTVLAGKMNAVVMTLRGAVTVARTTVRGSGMFVPENVKGYILDSLNNDERLIQLRLVDNMQSVLDGKYDPERWYNVANIIKDGIKTSLDSLKEDNYAVLLSKTISDVSKDIGVFSTAFKNFAVQTGQIANTFKMPLLLGAALLGGFVLYKYATAPLALVGMNGMPRRKRRKAKKVKVTVLR